MFVTDETTLTESSSPIVSMSTVNTEIKAQEIDEQMERFSETSSIELIIHKDTFEQHSTVKVPESHLMQFNSYPGSKGMGHVPVDIVKSFSPVLHGEKIQNEESDIYNDYVQNPYNLTLQIESSSVKGEVVSDQSIPSASTVFQSSSYFSNENNDTTSPGSELFNRP